MNRDDPLTPEERELARLLGRRAEQGPPPALDAAILAAARAAVDAPVQQAPAAGAAVRARRPRPRWPAVFGIAASMVFAIGIAWQMRPEPPPIPAEAQIASAPTPDDRPADAASGYAAENSSAAAVDAAEPSPPPSATAARPRAATAEPAPAAAAASAKAEPATPPKPAPVMAPPPAPMADSTFAAPAAPPPPVAPPQAPAAALEDYSTPAPLAAPSAAMKARRAATPTSDVADAGQDGTEERGDARAARQAATARTAPGVMRRASDAGLSAAAVQAEVQADAQLPRRQWLQKIRERRDGGDRDLARASLERYLQQYPESRLPKDLRPLLDD